MCRGAPNIDPPLLHANIREAGYGIKVVLQEAEVFVGRGEIVSLIGPNGSGKSTLLKALMGLITTRGTCRFSGVVYSDAPSANRLGLIYVPQGENLFADLTVNENLLVALPKAQRGVFASELERWGKVFPVVPKRLRTRAGVLSGGERQQVALVAALLKKPAMIMLDEPSLGLGPGLLEHTFAQIADLRDKHGTTFLIVEQKVREVAAISDRVYGLRQGRVLMVGTPERMLLELQLQQLFLA